MPRGSTAILAEIAVIEARLQSADSMVSSASSDGVSLSYSERQALAKRLDQLYLQADRASGAAPMFARGRVSGLRDA